jgi:hypothetical protein
MGQPSAPAAVGAAAGATAPEGSVFIAKGHQGNNGAASDEARSTQDPIEGQKAEAEGRKPDHEENRRKLRDMPSR